MKVPVNQNELSRLLKRPEGPTLEFKRSTAELREGMQTVCAFLNGSGGMVLFGARSDGMAEGQQVSDKTLREIAQAFERFEPPVNLPMERRQLETDREVVILRVDETSDSVPFTYEGRPFERVGSTTRKMSQDRYENLLLERAHSKRRWENQPAEEVTLKEIDREEGFLPLPCSACSLLSSFAPKLTPFAGRFPYYSSRTRTARRFSCR